MTRHTLLCAAAVALLSCPANAGEISIFPFPTQFVPQEITDIPVLMDVGFFVAIRDQDKLVIKLQQKSIQEYEGCTDVVIDTNFDLVVTCSIATRGVVPGDYACSVTPARLDVPGGTTTVCATLKNANLTGAPGGARDVQVATVTLKVAPR